MCGRFSQALPTEQMVRLFRAADRRSLQPDPSWNVAPSQSPTIIARDPTSGRRVLMQMEWGWLAPWENVPDYTAMRPINARCEKGRDIAPVRQSATFPALPGAGGCLVRMGARCRRQAAIRVSPH